MDAATRFETRAVGALPVITHYMEELGLAGAVDGAVPWEGHVRLGTLVEVLVVNRLPAGAQGAVPGGRVGGACGGGRLLLTTAWPPGG